tara:strand:+ start:1212 stop:1682 length:471 start_codon:yes stop_codon:yes gene_type:complete
MTDYSVRLMQDSDLEAVIELLQAASSNFWSPQLIQESLQSAHDSSVLFCRSTGDREANEIIGYSVIRSVLNECHLLNMAIKKSEQGKGLGSQFLDILIEGMEPQQSSLFLEVRASNLAAIKLYEKSGFIKTGVRKAYYPKEKSREDAWLYSLSLSG